MLLFHLILVLCTICVRSENEVHTYEPGKIHSKFYDLITLNNTTNSTCVLDILGTIDAMTHEMWAIKMLDSSSKLQSGFAIGNVFNLGSYDECLSVEGTIDDRKIKGKYCLFALFFTQFPRPNISDGLPKSVLTVIEQSQGLPIIESICVPDSCTSQDLTEISSSLHISDITSIKPAFSEQFCQVKGNTIEFTSLQVFALFLIVVDLFLIAVCTTYDLFLLYTQKKLYHKLLISFSLYTNIKHLTTVRHDPDQLPCINGIRFLSILWVILGHKYLFAGLYPHTNYLYTIEWTQEKTTSLVTAALFSVDTFFLISGLLVMYVVLLAKAKDFKFSLIHYYLHRIFRLSPAMFMLILIYMTFIEYLNNGPLKLVMYNIFQKPCMDYWWASLLFIQNTVEPQHLCVQQSWYLAVDTQLYVLAPLLFIPIKKWPKTTLAIIVILIKISCVSAFIITWDLKISVSYLAIAGSYRNVYGSTLVRSNAWLIGSLLGYYLFIKRGQEVKIHKAVVALLWILSIGIMSWIIYLQSYYNTTEYNRITASLYHSLSKPFWCLGLSWIIFACVHGYGGFVAKFLSNKVFVVLGRLTYAMYLVHILVIFMLTVRNEGNSEFSNANTIHDYLGDTIYVILCSIAWSLCFESPIIAVGKALIPEAMSDKLAKINEENEISHQQQINNGHFSTRL